MIAISFSRGSSPPRDWYLFSCVAGGLLHCRGILCLWATRGACIYIYVCMCSSSDLFHYVHLASISPKLVTIYFIKKALLFYAVSACFVLTEFYWCLCSLCHFCVVLLGSRFNFFPKVLPLAILLQRVLLLCSLMENVYFTFTFER